MNADELEDQLVLHDNRVQQHGVESAEAVLRQRKPDSADLIIATYRDRVGEPIRSGPGLVAEDHDGWYLPKPDHESPRWFFARSRIGLPPDVVEKTSRVADQILARLANPRADAITSRGLVLGHVQSGKTTSFLSVAAKAADNEYDLIIILAGVHNSLRRQTQDRAVRTLVHKRNLWWLGTALGDFKPDGNTVSGNLAGNGKRGLLVVKKHSTILRKLADWLEAESDADLRRLAVLVIDDEADQAGLDVGTGDELEGVHKQLSRIVNLQTTDGARRCAYLAYTATPYANILTSQDDHGLYPRDFIYPLDKPNSYVGSQELFGEERVGKPIRIESDVSDEVLTDGLGDAVRWFVVATAARAGLGEPLDSFHSSMLIHTTQKTADQMAYRPILEAYLERMADEFSADESSLREFYERTLEQVPARAGGGDGHIDEAVAPWSAVRPHVEAVLRRLIDREPSGEPFKEDNRIQHAHSGVIVDNSKVDWADRLTYSDLAAGEPSVTVIAVGGNTLSRGLTLEGLVSSYFARTARTYDSLMQMGRWFGYRPGYRHLLRVWTTQGLYDWFRELDVVEQDLRKELLWMQDKGLSPDRYGPRIRVSPNMNITRASAMKSVIRHISYSDTVIDPAWLDLNPKVLDANQALARALASDLGQPHDTVESSAIFRRVPMDRVARFIFGFRFHREEKRLDIPSLRRYLDKEYDSLQYWNVVFKSVGRQAPSTFDFGGQVGEVNTVTRGRVDGPSIAYIQSLVDSGDHRMDVGGAKPVNAERRDAHEPPLLVVYAIDRTSTPLSRSTRLALNAPTTPISLSVALPESESYVDYVAPAIDTLEEPDVIGGLLEEADA